MSNVITITGVKKLYKMGSETVAALNGVDLTIDAGEFDSDLMMTAPVHWRL